MSRIGKQPIKILSGTEVVVNKGGRFDNLFVTVKGPKGQLSQDIREGINVEINDGEINIINKRELDLITRGMHGLYRTLISNMLIGVTEGYSKILEIEGIGYKGQLKGRDLELTIGFNHPILVEAPEGIEFKVEEGVKIIVTGIDKVIVGEVAAKVRRVRPPEPYRGKGIRYQGEIVRRKEGKSAAGGAE